MSYLFKQVVQKEAMLLFQASIFVCVFTRPGHTALGVFPSAHLNLCLSRPGLTNLDPAN